MYIEPVPAQIILAALLLALPGSPSVLGPAPTFEPSRQITVAAAAELTFVFKDVAARLQKEAGIAVNLSFGSSGNFFARIQNGVPYGFAPPDARISLVVQASQPAVPGMRRQDACTTRRDTALPAVPGMRRQDACTTRWDTAL